MRFPAFAPLASFVVFAGFACLVATVACSNQGEGEFCDINAGNDDCKSGLACGPAPGVVGTNTDRCCPLPPAVPTTAACTVLTTTLDAATDVPDASVDGASAAEAGSESEASADAPAEGDVITNDATVSGSAPEAGLDGGTDAGSASDASDGAHE